MKYSSSDDRIAKVDRNGVVSGISVGVAVITITSPNGIVVKVNVTVGGKIDNKITITSGDFSIDALQKTTLKVIFDPIDTVDKSVTWTSSNPSVATISSYGYLEALKPGKTTITARSASGNVSKIVVTVNPPRVEYLYIFAYQTTFYVGYVGPIGDISVIPQVDNYSNVLFLSSNEDVIKVFSDGTMKAVGVGEADITISSLDGKVKNTVSFIVAKINPVDILIDEVIDVTIGASYTLNPLIMPTNTTYQDVTYTNYNDSIIELRDDGTITGKSVGSTTLTLNCDGITKDIIVNVLPKEITSITSETNLIEINVGEVIDLSYQIEPIDATYQNVLWKSFDPSIALVYGGTLKGVKEGFTKVSVTTLNGLEFIYYVYVNKKPSIPTISFDDIIINKGEFKYLDYDITYKEMLKFVVDTDKFAVIANDKIYALNEGKVKVDVYYDNVLVNSFNITVVNNKGCNATLTSFINLSILMMFVYIVKKKNH